MYWLAHPTHHPRSVLGQDLRSTQGFEVNCSRSFQRFADAPGSKVTAKQRRQQIFSICMEQWKDLATELPSIDMTRTHERQFNCPNVPSRQWRKCGEASTPGTR
eukprot:g28053.t1